MSELIRLEKEVLRMLLDGDDGVLISLRAQLDLVTVRSREISGVGFFANLSLSQTLNTSFINSSSRFRIGDVHADIEGLEFGAGFVLYVEDGAMKMLEGYSYGEPWSAVVDSFELSYVGGARDLEVLS